MRNVSDSSIHWCHWVSITNQVSGILLPRLQWFASSKYLSKNKQIYLRRQTWTTEPQKKKNQLNHNHATTVPPDPANQQPSKLQTTDPANPQPPNHRSGQPTATQTPNHHRYNHSNTDPATEILTYSHPNTATTKNKKRGENRGDKEKKGRVREIGEGQRKRE